MLELPPDWKPLLKAEYAESHEVQLYSNQRGLLLLIPEKRNGRVIGAAGVACKPLLLYGDDSALRSLRSLAGELTVLKKLNSKNSYLLAFSKPFHISTRDSLPSLAENHLKQLDKMRYTLARVEGVQIQELKEDSELFTDPALVLSFLKALHSEKEEKNVIGRDVSGALFSLSLSTLSSALIVGGTQEQRSHAMHLLIEEALGSNSCVLLFDSKSAFTGLASPNSTQLITYSAFGLAGSGAGYAFKQLLPGVNAFAQLSSFSPSEILSIFEVSENTESGTVLKEALANTRSFGDGLAFLAAAPHSQFVTRSAARILSVMEQVTPGLFSSTSLLVNEVSNSIGKVFHVDLSKVNPQVQALYVMCLLRALSSTDQRLFIVFEQPALEIKSVVEFALSTFTNKDACVVAQADHEEDFPPLASADLLIEIVEDGAVVNAAGQPPKRIELRPAYSQCSEL